MHDGINLKEKRKLSELQSRVVLPAAQLCTTCSITLVCEPSVTFLKFLPLSLRPCSVIFRLSAADNKKRRRGGRKQKKPESDRVVRERRRRTDSPLPVALLDRRRREGSEECGEGERERGGKEGHRQRKHENRPGAGRARQDRASRRRGGGGRCLAERRAERWQNTENTVWHCTACNRVRTAWGRRGISAGDRRTQRDYRQNTGQSGRRSS